MFRLTIILDYLQLELINYIGTIFLLSYNPYNQLPVVEVNSGTKELTKDYIKYLVASNKDSIVAIKSAKSLTLACMLLGIPPR